jgi:hypothetical protein
VPETERSLALLLAVRCMEIGSADSRHAESHASWRSQRWSQWQLLLAFLAAMWHCSLMPYRPRNSSKIKPDGKASGLESNQARAYQYSEQRRRDAATRSTLSRLRNRKSDLK